MCSYSCSVVADFNNSISVSISSAPSKNVCSVAFLLCCMVRPTYPCFRLIGNGMLRMSLSNFCCCSSKANSDSASCLISSSNKSSSSRYSKPLKSNVSSGITTQRAFSLPIFLFVFNWVIFNSTTSFNEFAKSLDPTNFLYSVGLKYHSPSISRCAPNLNLLSASIISVSSAEFFW